MYCETTAPVAVNDTAGAAAAVWALAPEAARPATVASRSVILVFMFGLFLD
jgi:hypothetical protein